MVPNGWKRQQLGSLAKIYDGTHQTPNYVDEGIPFYSVEHVTANQFEVTKFISEFVFEKESSRVRLERDDILMTRIGDIGTARLIDWDVKASFYVSLALIKHGKDFFSGYLANYINGALFRRELWKRTIHVAFPKKINLGEIGNCEVLLPPLPEQKKIAQILSTWDKAITTTEQLLANSQQQKKALMQQLLTGKKRLLDKNGVRFSGEWQKYTLGELGDTFNGLTGKTKDDFGFGKKYIPYINIFKNSRIDVSTLELVDVKEGESQSLSQYGDIFFTTSSETPDEVGMSSVLLDHVNELYLNSFCFGYRLFGFESLHPEFACYLLRSEHVRGEIAVLGQGATRYNLSKKQLMKLELTLPPVNEQKKIATVLSTADREISSLQQKLDALKQEKKALMQQLLTGKRRVTLN